MPEGVLLAPMPEVKREMADQLLLSSLTKNSCGFLIRKERIENMKKEYEGYGPILRFERELRGWSQQELVVHILAHCAKDNQYPALDTKMIGRWEREEHKPSPYYRQLLCQVFNRNAVQLGFIKLVQ